MNRVYRRIPGMFALIILFIAVMPVLATAQRRGGGAARPSVQKQPVAQKPAVKTTPAKGNVNPAVSNNRAGNKAGAGNRANAGNGRDVNINIDNSKDIRINNSRNTAVRHVHNYRPYPRPPYRYGGFRYHCYHPYFYHPYRPFYWGPVWHPWGFFIATLAATAIIVSVVDNDLQDLPVAYEMHIMGGGNYADDLQSSFSGGGSLYNTGPGAIPLTVGGEEYYYDEGVFYLKGAEGYTVVAGPVGATVPKLPSGYETIKLDDGSTNYYYGGTFYEKTSKGYKVVPPTAGAVVENLPDGGEEVNLGDVKYVKLGEIYFQPIQQDGKNMYEIASVEEDK